jgi:hypothetical protein
MFASDVTAMPSVLRGKPPIHCQLKRMRFLGRFLLRGLAEIEARAGRAEEAVKIIRELITAPAGQFIALARLKIDPVWDPIRNDPGFQKLISEPEPVTVYK